MSASVDSLLARLADAERRLVEHADDPLPGGLTEPDPGAEERWEAGQVWAHLAEFPAYWLTQAERVIAQPTNAPIPFGRVKTDAARIAAIERDRHTDPAALLARVLDRALHRADHVAHALELRGFQGRVPGLPRWRPQAAEIPHYALALALGAVAVFAAGPWSR